MLEPLANASLNPDWLRTELEKQDVALENVFLGQVDDQGKLYLDLYDDHLAVAEPSQSALLLATIKKCQADLEIFSLATDNQNSKEIYQRCSKNMNQVQSILEPYLK